MADTTPPTIAITSNKTALKAGDTALITFTLSEPATDFVFFDVAISGGTLSNFTGSASSYSATFTPNQNSTVEGSVSVGNFKFSDSAGNPNVDGAETNNQVSLSIDTVSPSIAITSDKTYLGFGESAKIKFTLSEPSNNFDFGDVIVSNGFLSGFNGSADRYTAIFTPNSDQTARISVSNNKFTDLAGNQNSYGNAIDLIPYSPTRGNILWSKLLGTVKDDVATGVTVTKQGGVIITGFSWGDFLDQKVSGETDAFVIMLSPDGDLQWKQSIGSSGRDIPVGVAEGPDGSLFVVGSTYSASATVFEGHQLDGMRDTWIAKYSPEGSKQWISWFSGGGSEIPHSIAVSPDGSLLIAGEVSGAGSIYGVPYDFSRPDAFVTKYGSDGKRIWTKILGAKGQWDRATSVQIDLFGSVFISRIGTDSLNTNINLVKFDSDGNELWTSQSIEIGSISSYDNAASPSVSVQGDGSIILGGETYRDLGTVKGNGGIYGSDGFLVKLKSDGSVLWKYRYGDDAEGYYTDAIKALTSSRENKLYFLSRFSEWGLSEVLSGGVVGWTTRLDIRGSANAITTDSLSNVYVIGESSRLNGQTSKGGSDAFIAKLSVPSTLPSVALASDKQSLKVGETVVVTITLSKSSTDFVLSDVTFQGGMLSDFKGSGTSYTVMFTPGLDAPSGALLSVTSGKFSDNLGQFNEDGAEANNKLTFSVAPPTYKVMASASSANEGTSASFILQTTNIVSDFAVPYTISGVTASDLIDVALSGAVTIDSMGKAIITLPIAEDRTTEGSETLSLTIKGSSASVQIIDSSKSDGIQLEGKPSNDPLTGGSGDDSISGIGGCDTLVGGGGDDILDGGADIDVASYSMTSSNYKLSFDENKVKVSDKNGAEGTDTLISVERLKFSDKSLAIDLEGNSGNAARLLATVFGKESVKNPTYAGIAISLFDQGYSKDQVSQVALNAVFGTNAKSKDVVSLVWKNLTGSEIDTKNLADLSSLIDSKAITAAQLVTKATDLDLTAQVIDLVGLSKTGWEYIPYGG